MELHVPDFSLVVLVGPSGAGKSSFAARHFLDSEVVSSDACRRTVADDELEMSANEDAFDLVHYTIEKRLQRRNLTVVDATNLERRWREPLVDLGETYHAVPVAVVLKPPRKVARERNRQRDDRQMGEHVLDRQYSKLYGDLGSLEDEGFERIYTFDDPAEVEEVEIVRRRLPCDRRDESGPFDIIGDVHGCFDELCELLAALGYDVETGETVDGDPDVTLSHPDGRRAVFVGDLVDRGPKTPEVLALVMNGVEAGTAFCVPGNHDDKLARALDGANVTVSHGLGESLEQLEKTSDAFRRRVVEFVESLPSHLVLDDGDLVVAHAGLRAEMHGRQSDRLRDFALYGETTGETDEFGLPVRYDWSREYRGDARVVYGHTPVEAVEAINNTFCIDTGCVYGERLTALRHPSGETVAVEANEAHARSVRTVADGGRDADQAEEASTPEALLSIEDVRGKRRIETELMGPVTIQPGESAAAVETLSRWAVDPRWLPYLPPTMSAPKTSSRDGYLEHPDEVFDYYRSRGVEKVVCEKKHMGSRAVIIVGRDPDVLRDRFQVPTERTGICYTRTGRRFFDDRQMERAFVERVAGACGEAGLWEQLGTDWLLLDAELMPWSTKAEELLQEQFAPVGAAARQSSSRAVELLEKARDRGVEVGDRLERFRRRREDAARYTEAYRPYCWPVEGVDDLAFAPFHLLAGEGEVYADRDHPWHMSMASKLAEVEETIVETACRTVELADDTACKKAVDWWAEMTEAGDEGIVVKPESFVAEGRSSILQAAIKCRGREYLRLVYGPEYTRESQLEELRKRNVGKKGSLARREFALGLEGLQRFVDGEPLWRVHECVMGVLALESTPVDPTL